MISLNKEKNLVDDYVVFDLETTGFDPKTAKIIEIGALKYRNNELIEEDGKAEIQCQFCNQKYKFNKEELEEILKNAQKE